MNPPSTDTTLQSILLKQYQQLQLIDSSRLIDHIEIQWKFTLTNCYQKKIQKI